MIWGNCCTFDIFVLGKISDAQPWGQDEGFNPVKLYLNRFIVKLGTILIYILQKVFTFSAVQLCSIQCFSVAEFQIVQNDIAVANLRLAINETYVYHF